MPEYHELEPIASQERTMERQHLGNGLIVHFIDMSSPPVAGRCKVRLVIRVFVEPVEDHFSSYPDPSRALQQFISLAGPGPAEFRTVKKRSFIALKEVEKTLVEMKDDFMRTGLEYLNKPGFAANFITRKYEELLAGAAVGKAHGEALRGVEGDQS
jgi:hypothetical protein